MKKFKILISVILSLAIMISTMTFVSAASDNDFSVSTVMTGNSGAVITASETVSAYTEDTSLVRLFVSDSTVVVKAKDDAVGIATVVINTADDEATVEIPVGYTTFEFSDDTLTVYSGSCSTYEILGINTAAEEYTPESSFDEDGNVTYSNTDTYSIDVEIKKKGGSFVFYGESDDMCIAVKKEATGAANLMFAGLELSSAFTSPLTIKKNSTSSVTLNILDGFENTLSDVAFNNADIYGDTTDGGDGTNVNYAESAVIKAKASAQLTICGGGTLNLNCNSKNAIKVGEYGSLTIEDVTLNVNSVSHGISSDNTITINSGNINVTATEDGIRTNPDAVDSTVGTSALININGGNITIQSGSDAIQSAQDITITGGNFNITTGAGYNDSSFDSDTMSCKGIKASFSTDEDADTSEATNTIAISGGTFNLNCADDAIHSDAYANITGGVFNIQTGDDGMHADTTLNIGYEDADNCDTIINVVTSYEGLEAGTVNIYSGNISVVASDDGVNAAGGSDSSDNPGGGGFNPGGGGGFNPGGGGSIPGSQGGSSSTTTTSDYAINIYGGDIYVNVDGDGLDSNGALTLNGGYIVVFGQAAGGDNEPLDSDGTLSINGATVFAAGSSAMITTPQNSQSYVTTKNSISSGKTVNVVYNSSTVFNILTNKSLNYVLYSSPDMTSTSGWSITSSTASVIEPTVSAVELFAQPTKTDYLTGESLDVSGLELKVTYSNDRTARVSTGYTLSGYDMSTAGEQTVTVSYEGYTVEFTINVAENTRIIKKSVELKSTSATFLEDGITYLYGITPKLTVEDFESNYISTENLSCEYEMDGSYIETGTIIYLKSDADDTITATYVAVLYGDVNCDGVYDGTDASVVACLACGMLTKAQVGDAIYSAADCNHDGTIDSNDVDILINAGLLLSQVEQTSEFDASSIYEEYLDLIDQCTTSEEDTTHIVEAVVNDSTSFIEKITAFFSNLINFFKTIFQLLK